MKLIVGLGNPGRKYENTRHNVGFKVIDDIANNYNVSINKNKFDSLYTDFFHNGEKIVLLKPQTYMNLSGEAVKACANYYSIDSQNILIITDDLNLPIGKIRVRMKGSSGGQNGLKNIIHHLGTQDFPRLRIGIGRNHHIDTVSYVLGKIDSGVAINQAVLAVSDYVDGISLQNIMNEYNQ